LVNALSRSSVLEAKLKASTKALGGDDKKRADEVAATKLATDRAVKEAEARATKAKKSLAEISKKQSQCKEAIIKRIDDLLTTFGSKYRLIAFSLVLTLFLFILNGCSFMMQQNNLEKSLDFVQVKPKILYLMSLACWSRTAEMSGMFSSILDIYFPVCLSGCPQKIGKRCQHAT
jgi:Flp pilus assembly protein TadB